MKKAVFFGKHRGVVSDVEDPNHLGRIRAHVPGFFEDQESGWALPSVPYAGDGVGLFLIPPVGAHVWFEFEQGNPEHPIWSGCFWESNEQLPSENGSPALKALKTTAGTLSFSDKPGEVGITVETSDGMKIAFTASGIEISNGQAKITIQGPQVSVNDGALEVV